MATTARQVSCPPDLLECPVCQDDFKDPKILVCSHQFCRVCLEDTVGRKSSLTCPTCCQETQLGPEKQVADLPHPVLVNELQRKICSLLDGVHKRTRECDPCGGGKVTAAHHCYNCRQHFCDACGAKHKKIKKFESHRTEPISTCVFCDSHSDDIVTDYCKTCKKGVCLKCIMGDHFDHMTEDIYVMAEAGCCHLEEFIKQGGLFLDHAELREVNNQISEAETLQTQFQDSASHLKGLVKEFAQKLDDLERNTETKLSTEVKNMKEYGSTLHDWVSSKDSLSDFAKHLLDRSPELEIEMEFTPSTDGTTAMTPYTANLPHFEDTFNYLSDELKDLIDHCDIHYHSRVLGKRSAGSTPDVSPLIALSETHSFSVGSKINGLAFDTQRQCLLTCTADKAAPIQVYDYHGKLLKKLGRGVKELVNNEVNGISLDTKRSLYLCLVKGALILIDRAGKLTATVKIERSMSTGISYSEDQDVYVASDWSEHKVYVIDANSRKIVREIGGQIHGDNVFDGPYNVHVGHVKGISQPVIIVSDWFDKSVKLHDIKGQHIKTYATRGEVDGRLCNPWGVTSDPAGRILVCDRGNKRVLSFWSENKDDQWRSVVGSTKLKEDVPWYVSCDPLNRALAVGFESGLIQVFR